MKFGMRTPSFKKSFNEVYAMNPHQLQLGFLKVLSGAPMEGMTSIHRGFLHSL